MDEIDDPDNRNGNNLAISGPLELKLTADLAMTGLSGPSQASIGQTINVSGTLANLDAIAPVYGNISVHYFLSKDKVLDESDKIVSGGFTRRNMSAGQTYSFNRTATLPSDVEPGSYYLMAIVDYYQQVDEIDDPDNRNGNNLAVSGPLELSLTSDLAIMDFNSATAGLIGSNVTVNGTLSNLDSVGPIYGSIQVNFFLSQDTVLDSADLMVGSAFSLSSMSAGQDRDFSRSIYIPASVTPGNYYLMAIVDYYQHVDEIDDPDNLNGNNLGIANAIAIKQSNNAPTALISGPISGFANMALGFSGAGSVDPDGDVLQYRWDMGDGNTYTGVGVTHYYLNGGTYTVTLTVSDGIVDSTPATHTVTITVSGGGGSGGGMGGMGGA